MTDRPIYHLSDPYLHGYRWLIDREDRVRLHTSREHKDLAGQYLMGLHLTYEAFRPGRSYKFSGTSTQRPGVQSHNLRQQLLALSARTARPAFDLLLGGYYSEGMSLVRTMLESWGRAIYVRLRPDQYGPCYAPPDDMPEAERAQWGHGKPEPSFGSEIASVVQKHGTDRDKAIFEEMTLRYRLMNPMVHPSGEAINQLRNATDDKFLFGPDYFEEFCRQGFNHGIFVQLAVLAEIRLLGSQSQEWDAIAKELSRLFETLHASIQPLLNEVKREIDEEPGLKVLGPSRQDVKQAYRTIAQWEATANAMKLPLSAVKVRSSPCERELGLSSPPPPDGPPA